MHETKAAARATVPTAPAFLVAAGIAAAECRVCLGCDVRHMAVCAALPDADILRLERIVTGTTLCANEMLVQQGETRRRVFSLTSGMLRLFRDLPDGRRQIAGFLLPGDYLGLADDAVYEQSAEAVVPSTLCTFQLRDMEKVMADFPLVRDRLYAMTRAALRQARDNQMVLGRLAPVEKLASFLLVLHGRVAAQSGAAAPDRRPLLHLQMTRTDIADFLGLTIETVSRSFTKLRQQGLIRLPEPHVVEIVDRRSLIAVSGLELPA